MGLHYSGDKYKGKYPSPNEGEETYSEYYKRVRKCREEGFHLGDLNFSDYQDYCYGSPEGGGQYIRDYIIGEVPESGWTIHIDEDEDDEF